MTRELMAERLACRDVLALGLYWALKQHWFGQRVRKACTSTRGSRQIGWASEFTSAITWEAWLRVRLSDRALAPQ